MDRFPKPKVETSIFEITDEDRMRSCIRSLFQSMPQQFGFDTTTLFPNETNVTRKSMSNVEIDEPAEKRSVNGEHFESDLSSTLYAMGDAKKIMNEDAGSKKQLSKEEQPLEKPESQYVTMRSKFISEGQPSMKVTHDTLMVSANDNIVDVNISFVGSNSMDGTNNVDAASNVHTKESSRTARSKRYRDVMDALLKPVSSYTLLYETHLVPKSKKTPRKKVVSKKVVKEDEIKLKENHIPCKRSVEVESGDEMRFSVEVESGVEIKSKENLTPHKVNIKLNSTKKWESFPNNVKALTATFMLDGVGVKYLSASREKELRGIIKGTSYICGCKSCNYSNELNADQFEDHAGCKTSHPNNHIYLENDLSQLQNVKKSLHMIVQELKHTSRSMLCDAIQTLIGASLNQEAFSSWKKSFEAVSSKR